MRADEARDVGRRRVRVAHDPAQALDPVLLAVDVLRPGYAASVQDDDIARRQLELAQAMKVAMSISR